MRLFQILLEKQYLQKVLLENRLDYLRQKYVPLIQAHFEKLRKEYPRDVDHFLEQILHTTDLNSDEVFNWIVALDPEPTKKFSQWILNMFLKFTFSPEDGYKITEYLQTFERIKNRLPVDKRDINRYPTYRELYDVIEPYRETLGKAELEKLHKEEMKGQAKILYDDSNYKIVVPLTQEAACFYGINTQWCTAAKNSNNMFDDYNKQGDLYIILDKKNNRRWQFHFETGQLMDERDSEINVREFVENHPFIEKFFKAQDEKNFIKDIVAPGRTPNKLFKTDKGYVIKSNTGLYGRNIGHLTVKDDYLIDGAWAYNGETSNMIMAQTLNELGIKGKEDQNVTFAHIYYRGKWGTFGQIATPVVKVNNFVWKALDGTSKYYKTVFKLCDGDRLVNENSGRSSFECTLSNNNIFIIERATTNFAYIMPLIKARDDILYWGPDSYSDYNFTKFYELDDVDKEWILKNRPTLCNPEYSYKRIGLTDAVKQSILKMFSYSNKLDTNKHPYWVDDHLLVWEFQPETYSANKILREYSIFDPELSLEEKDQKLRNIRGLYYIPKAEYGSKKLSSYKKGYSEDGVYVLLAPAKVFVKNLDKLFREKCSWLYINKVLKNLAF